MFQGSSTVEPTVRRSLQVAMRLLHVAHRVGLADLDAHDAAADHVEEFGCRLEQVGAFRSVGEQRGSREEQRAALREFERSERRDGPGRIAIRDHQAERAQRIERSEKRVLADGVVDDVRALPARELLHARSEVVAALDQHVLATHGPHHRCLGVAADDGDHVRAEMQRPLRQDAADAAGGGVHDDDRALAHLVRPAQQYLRRHALEQRGGGESIADTFRHWHQAGHRQHALVGVGARRRRCVRDAVADLEIAHARTDGFHHTRRLPAKPGRQRAAVQPGALVDVDEVESDGRLPHQCLAAPRGNGRDFFPAHHFRTAVGMDSDGVGHGHTGGA